MRSALRHVVVPFAPCFVVAIAASCSSQDVVEPLPGPSEWNRRVVAPSDGDAALARARCAYAAGALPAETQGEGHPNGSQIPIDHIVVAKMENRSFDHYFQKARDVGLDVDVAPEGFTNPDAEGNPVAPFHQTTHCFVDTSHSWSSIRRQIGGGKMDGFAVTNDGIHELPAHGAPEMLLGRRAMGYYTESDIPFAYWMAKNFSIGDRYFASAPTATWPNRMHLFAASSFGLKSNDFPEGVTATLFDMLNTRKVSWKYYSTRTPSFAIILERFLELRKEEGHFVPIDEFYQDAAAGKLPQFAFLDPDGTADKPYTNGDEHPPAPATIGQSWLNKAVGALARSPQWGRSAMFITYDEHGGLYDHVPPPKACPPDQRSVDPADAEIFGSYGVRVPFFVVSPFAKKGYVSHTTYDHTSIVRFVEARFVLPALSGRDANAAAPWDVFDFAHPPTPHAPSVPDVPVDEAIVSACKAVWE